MTRPASHRPLALIAGLLLSAGAAVAQSYPAKPVNLMVPYPPGGPSDAIARIFFNPLGKELGQQVLVENLGGVSGALAAQAESFGVTARIDWKPGYSVLVNTPAETAFARSRGRTRRRRAGHRSAPCVVGRRFPTTASEPSDSTISAQFGR